MLTGTAALSASFKTLRSRFTSLLCTQAQQTDSAWMGSLPLEECAESLSAQWTGVLLILILGLCLKAHATLVVRLCPPLLH